ncbi:MAG: MBOAT family protein [Ruminococcaceae bacterium]|nr:MBOAT family protein [Oscillospiraceae bacterium]
MLFNSIDFMIFFPVVTLIYFVIPNKVKYLWLLAASYYFYMCWNAKYALLILFSTIITYLSGILIESVKTKSWDEKKKNVYKKIVVALSFVINLSILFFFKYFNFAFSILARAFAQVNIQLSVPVFDVILPVGISFYTFQALSYTMDVYRDDIYAEKNFFRYALFVSFFPQLVAGPIERSKNLLKQLAVPQKFKIETAREGVLLMIWGFFLKMVLADRVAIFVDTVYGNIAEFTGYYLVVATVLFAVQIYCDFAGYSTIAMGAAKILGINLMENFDAPYLSTSVAAFWRRWHISLTSWFKDYLYIPLGGSRKGALRKYINKMIVFLVSGLWHGASISFVVWGGLNGLYQIIEEITAPIRDKFVKVMHFNRESIGHKLFQTLLTFVLVDFSWIFFRANGFSHGVEIVKSILNAENLWILFDGSLYTCGLDAHNFYLMIICIFILIFADICKRKNVNIVKLIATQDWWFRSLVIAISISFILLFGKWGPSFDQANFIYFQF